eukprot:TRINITY_DN80_c1_g1_i1.p1 TRINITY_DN80_c1_g1~~TRINITY_DN80_c1_g1_i1.p1  ORF type:complete len:274 (-),score=22.17 TRINITY_DN80_c1_g1_i1:308-1129(-)
MVKVVFFIFASLILQTIQDKEGDEAFTTIPTAEDGNGDYMQMSDQEDVAIDFEPLSEESDIQDDLMNLKLGGFVESDEVQEQLANNTELGSTTVGLPIVEEDAQPMSQEENMISNDVQDYSEIVILSPTMEPSQEEVNHTMDYLNRQNKIKQNSNVSVSSANATTLLDNQTSPTPEMTNEAKRSPHFQTHNVDEGKLEDINILENQYVPEAYDNQDYQTTYEGYQDSISSQSNTTMLVLVTIVLICGLGYFVYRRRASPQSRGWTPLESIKEK